MKENIEKRKRKSPKMYAPYREGSFTPTVHAKPNLERANTSTPIEADLNDDEEVRTGVMGKSTLESALQSAEEQADLDDWPQEG